MKRELEEVERERERLQQNTRLRRQPDAPRRAGYRLAAKALTPRPKHPGRRAGAQYGQPARRYRPTRVDVRHDVPLPPSCPASGGRVRSTGLATQLQEELPVPRVVVREFPAALGARRDCGRRVQGRHRLPFNFLRNPAIDATNWRAEQAHSPHRGHPQGVWRQSLLPPRGHAPDAGLGHPHRLPTPVLSARRGGPTSTTFAYCCTRTARPSTVARLATRRGR